MQQPSTFDDCLAFVLRPDIEGGNVDNPNDPGGRTSRGVTQRTYDAWRHKSNLPTQDVYAMSDAECATIYEGEYWTPSHCDALEPPVALYVFDMSVNMGISASIKTLQKSCFATVDGAFGPETLAKVNAVDDAALVSGLHTNRADYYKGLSSFERYGKGWLARNDACRNLAMSWTDEGELT